NVTSTKQTVNGASGIVVLGSHDNLSSGVDTKDADYYFHNYINLGGALPTATPPSPTPTATTTPHPTATPTIGTGDMPKPWVYVPMVAR
ncbi:MAG TPA: hypothetical protein VKE41_17805, partial [Roseiflexaceae bacterium]|nr:hypothetical protein [Roseiflexaceae bacterium]